MTKVGQLLIEYRTERQPVALHSEIAMSFDIAAKLRLPIREEAE